MGVEDVVGHDTEAEEEEGEEEEEEEEEEEVAVVVEVVVEEVEVEEGGDDNDNDNDKGEVDAEEEEEQAAGEKELDDNIDVDDDVNDDVNEEDDEEDDEAMRRQYAVTGSQSAMASQSNPSLARSMRAEHVPPLPSRRKTSSSVKLSFRFSFFFLSLTVLFFCSSFFRFFSCHSGGPFVNFQERMGKLNEISGVQTRTAE